MLKLVFRFVLGGQENSWKKTTTETGRAKPNFKLNRHGHLKNIDHWKKLLAGQNERDRGTCQAVDWQS